MQVQPVGVLKAFATGACKLRSTKSGQAQRRQRAASQPPNRHKRARAGPDPLTQTLQHRLTQL